VAHRLDGGEHDRQVLRAAAGHDGVDRDLLHRRAAVVGRDERDQLVAGPARGRDGALDQTPGGRNDREPVGDAALEEALDRVSVWIVVGLWHAQEANTGARAVGRRIGCEATAANTRAQWLSGSRRKTRRVQTTVDVWMSRRDEKIPRAPPRGNRRPSHPRHNQHDEESRWEDDDGQEDLDTYRRL